MTCLSLYTGGFYGKDQNQGKVVFSRQRYAVQQLSGSLDLSHFLCNS